jgi:hypothetical protein
MGRILRRLKQLRFRSFDRSDHAGEWERSVENPDALAATGGSGGQDAQGSSIGSIHAGGPPGYVKPDDGRPRH